MKALQSCINVYWSCIIIIELPESEGQWIVLICWCLVWPGPGTATNAGLATTKLQHRSEKTVHSIIMTFLISRKSLSGSRWNGIYAQIPLIVCNCHFCWPRLCWSCVVSSGPCVSRADTGAGAGRENAGDWVTGGARGGEDRYTGTRGKGTWPTYLPGAYYIELHQT